MLFYIHALSSILHGQYKSVYIYAILIRFKSLSCFLFSREMFKRNFNSVEMFPCYEDEWCKMCFTDYAVKYSDHPPNAWFLVFR